MSDLLVSDAYNLSPCVQVAALNLPKYYYKGSSQNGQGPSQASQTATTVTDASATFTSSMIGGQIFFAENTSSTVVSAMILAVPSSTTLTVNVSQTVDPTQYTIWYGGVQAHATGAISAEQFINPEGYLNASSVDATDTLVGAFITKEIALTAASLATAGQITIQAAVTGAQFRVRDVKVNYSASGLSGGGGDRLVRITDGTTVYNNAGITAALLGTPVNTVWGGTGNPLPGTVAMNTATAAGAKLYAVYAGGTADFTTGTVNITVALERVA